MNKPEPTSFEKHRFEEERARRLLMYCFPEKYLTSELSESPDIIVPSLSIGIEVTESIRQSVRQNMSRASDITGKTLEEFTNINKVNIEKGRIIAKEAPNRQYISGFAMWGSFHDLSAAYIRKAKKLNANHFTVLKENNLLFLSWMIDDEELSAGIQKIRQYYTENSEREDMRHFDNVYICMENRLVHMDMKEQRIIPICIPDKVMLDISERSFFEILGVTRNQYFSP